MSKQDNELAERLGVMDLADVAQALHELADRIGERGLQTGRRRNRVEPPGGYSAESDASSTTNSRDRHDRRNPVTPQIARSRRQDQQSDLSSDTDHHSNAVPRSRYSRPVTQRRSDTQPRPVTQPRVDLYHQDTQVDSHQLDPRADSNQLDPRVSAHHLDPHVGALHSEPRVGARRSEPRVGTPHSEPRVDFFRPAGSHRMEPRVVTRHFHDTGRNFVRGTWLNHSSPPSPTFFPRTLSPEPPAPLIHQGLNAPTVTQSRSLPQAETREPVIAVSDHSDLGDIYNLDVSYVQLRDPGCKKAIHTPPRGERGPKGRWYFVCVGREVGIFNDWSEVLASTDKLSGNSQQSTSSEAAAYAAFKRALLQGKVWVAK